MPFQLALLTLLLALVAVAMRAGSVGLTPRPEEPRSVAAVLGVRRSFVLLLGLALGLAVWEWRAAHDWTHFAWIVQGCLIVGFLGSGCWLAEAAAIELDSPADERPLRLTARPWVFPLLLALIAALVPTLMTASPSPAQAARAAEPHWPALIELARFGFGGARPASLEPLTAEQISRGLGALPRPLSVSASLLYSAALLAVAFALLRLLAGRLEQARPRASLRLIGPWVLWMVLVLSSSVPADPFDAGFFLPGGIDQGGLWKSEPVSLRAFGPVLTLGLLCALLAAVPGRSAARAA